MMEDFRDYAKRTANERNENSGKDKKNGASGNAGGLYETVSRLAKNFDGKSQNDLLRAIFAEAEKGKRAGTLTNAEIDNFVALLSPALDGKKRAYLRKIAEDIKKI